MSYKNTKRTFALGTLLSAFSLVSHISIASNYCSSSGGGTYEFIENVTVGDLNNTSNGISAYTDFTGITGNLTLGNNAISITPGFTNSSTYTEHFAVYIDYNQDGDFSDNNELVMSGSGNSTVNGNISVPQGASGTTRMRVLMKYQQPVLNSCENIVSGEVEDYTVSFNGALDNIEPTAELDGPYFGDINTSIPMSSNNSHDTDGHIVSWLWDFGDGANSNSANPNHVYSTAGTYNVTLTITDDDGATSLTSSTATITDPTLPPNAYCSVTGGGTYEWIANVQLNNLNHSSTQSEYSDYTDQIADLATGNNTINLTPGFRVGSRPYTEYWSVWIDFNNDGDFTDSGEQVVANVSSQSAISATILVPSSATGSSRMRIGMKYNQSHTNACSNIPSGEFEDYTVSFSDVVTPPITDLPDMCASEEPTTANSLSDGVPVCIPATAQRSGFSISGTNKPTSIAITTQYGLGNLSLEANTTTWPKSGDNSIRSSHVGNTECIVINNPSDNWNYVNAVGLFKGASIVADFNTTECRAAPGAFDPGNVGYQYNNVNVLIYPFEFSDTPLEFTSAQINEEMEKTKQYYQRQSYGNFDVTWQIMAKTTINEPKSTYDNNKPLWGPKYREKLTQAGVDPSFPGEATIIMITAPMIGPTVATSINSQAAPPSMEIYTYKAGTIAHEIGHALGLHHSMSVEGGNVTLNSSNDTIRNYGNPHAMMGMGAHTMEEYNLMYKSYFKGWLKETDAPVISTSGNFKIYAFDHGTESGTNAPGRIGLRLKSGNDLYTYWLEYRTTNDKYKDNTKNGVLVNIQGYKEDNKAPWWNHTSGLLDMTPNSQSNANWAQQDETDAELAIGKSFTDPWGGFRITTLGKGGIEDTASAYIEVKVEIF